MRKDGSSRVYREVPFKRNIFTKKKEVYKVSHVTGCFQIIIGNPCDENNFFSKGKINFLN